MSRQSTEYRDHITNGLIARVSEHVQGHHAGEVIILPDVGRCYIAEICPVEIYRDDFTRGVAVHTIKVRSNGSA